jgi:hypothetical protein
MNCKKRWGLVGQRSDRRQQLSHYATSERWVCGLGPGSPCTHREERGVKAAIRCSPSVSSKPSAPPKRHFLLELTLQRTADNRVRVRLNGKQFLPAVHNHEAEVHFGLPLRRYGGRARAVLIDPVRTGNRLVCES